MHARSSQRPSRSPGSAPSRIVWKVALVMSRELEIVALAGHPNANRPMPAHESSQKWRAWSVRS